MALINAQTTINNTQTTLDKARHNFAPYEHLRGTVGTRECAIFREAIFDRHWPLMSILVKHYEHLATTQSHREANIWLRESDERLKLQGTRLYLHSDIDALNEAAEEKAKALQRHIMAMRGQLAGDLIVQYAKDAVARMGIPFPSLPEKPTEAQQNAALARVMDEVWLRKQLRVKQWREMEAFLIELGKVSKRKGIYVSDFSMKRRHQQKDRTARLLERMEAVNELGEVFSLAELSELSVSNPINRRNELMTRLDGFNKFTENSDEAWQGVMFTVTCPSKYHAVLSNSGDINPRFNNTTPRNANEYLNKVWQRTRAAWDREDIRVFGFRVAEPHHDGTPHWHLALFIRPEQLDHAEAIFKHYAMAEDGDEPGAKERRFTTVKIDPSKGSMAGYLAKYIAKNIDGYGIETDLYGKDAVHSAMRIEAWASLWGIRQFQQIGGPSVTVWRELRRLDAEGVDQELVQQLTVAADNGDWALYTALMGGATCKREERPVRPYMMERNSPNKYGEVMHILKGIWFGPQTIVTRIHEWIISALDPAIIDQRAQNDTTTHAANDDTTQAANDNTTAAANDDMAREGRYSEAPGRRASPQFFNSQTPQRGVTLEFCQ